MATKPDEALILIEEYGNSIAFPAHLAGEILPHLIAVERKYEDGVYVEYTRKDKIKFTLLSADEHTAMKVRTLLRDKGETS